MPTTHELGQASEIALNKYKEAYEKFPKKKLPDGTEAPDIPAEGLKSLNDLYAEVDSTGRAYDEARRSDEQSKKVHDRLAGGAPDRGGAPAGGRKAEEDGTVQAKSLGEMFVESKGFKDGHVQKEAPFTLDVDVKTLMTTGVGYAPESVRSGRVVLSSQRPPTFADSVPSGTISQVANVYMRETVYTNSAAETAEGGAMPEAALQLAQINEPVQKIAVFLPVTDEQLADVAGIRSYVDNRLSLMLTQRLDYQLVNGNGTSPNLRGFLNVPGIQVQARGTDPAFDAWLKAVTKVSSGPGYYNASAMWMNPVDWQNLLLTRTSTDKYVLGDPGMNPADARIWGKPVVVGAAMPQGTGLVGDFLGNTEMLYYQGIEIMVTNSNNDDFTKGRQCIRATMRGINTVYSTLALCEVTGLAPN